jgi:hypothetical protein
MPKRLLAMGVSNVPALIDRTYRESHPYQWVREALINAKEAGATRVHFGIEWRGVENYGIYRRLILDNGRGMTADKMLLFLNTYGGSGKPIGGEHENFGHGFKTSALPWNRNGIVVVSKSAEDGSLAMVRLEYDSKTNEYGARYEEVEGIRDAVYAPYDASENEGVDYSKLIPEEWTSGVAILLLGSVQQPDTVLGAYDRDESDLNGIARYLNSRMWDLAGVHVTVDYFNSQNRKLWPTGANDKDIPNTSSKKWQSRSIRGAKYHIEFQQKGDDAKVVGEVTHHGAVEVAGGLAKIHWYLRNGTPTQNTSVAMYRGYIGHLYKNEVFTILNHPSSFRSFGIPGWLKENLFLVVEPIEFNGAAGAYPNDARTQLLLGGKEAGRALPVVEWANEFANNLPVPIVQKIAEHFDGLSGTLRDDKWKARLAERFGFLWRIIKPIVNPQGTIHIRPVQPIHKPGTGTRPTPVTREIRETGEETAIAGGLPDTGDTPAADRSVYGGLPDYEIAKKEEFDEPWILASWETASPANGNRGRVLINRDHSVVKKHIAEAQRSFVGNDDEIAGEALAVYGELAVAHIAHSEQMKGTLMSAQEVNDLLRSDAALTMALLGMWQVDNILMPRLTGKMTKRKIA